MAISRPDESAGVESLNKLISDGQIDRIRNALSGRNALQVTRALGGVTDQAALPLLGSIASNAEASSSLRETAISGLAKTRAGAELLLAMDWTASALASLKPHAADVLSKTRFPEVTKAARDLFGASSPRQGDAPSLARVLGLTGDIKRGEELFFGTAACAVCHQVKSRGVDFGPALSDIGDKFSPEAMYAAIVEPSSGIAFGYETWQITLRNGAAFGFIVSETDDELTVKAPGNIVSRYPKSEVVSRQRVEMSVMPPTLLQAQEAADLISYLTSLKKGN